MLDLYVDVSGDWVAVARDIAGQDFALYKYYLFFFSFFEVYSTKLIVLFFYMPDLYVDAAGDWVVVARHRVNNSQVPRLTMVQSGIR